MIIRMNGCEYEVAEGTTLSSFTESIGLKPEGIAAAIDYEVVPKESWCETVLTEGIEIMIIHAVSGG